MEGQNHTERGAVMEENKPYWEGKHFSFYHFSTSFNIVTISNCFW